MRTFLSAKDRFAVHLRPEDVQAALSAEHRPADLDAVVKALDSLVGWGNLRSDPDTARVTRRGRARRVPEPAGNHAVHRGINEPAHQAAACFRCRSAPSDQQSPQLPKLRAQRAERWW
ncbi:DUF2397 family protein [Streptomyces roseochromogenus]|uniref:DUF2397 family protein n=1 Tax=Streptomyces roseochromogenus TaxID=285450 RepID=UPI001FD7FB62|nr:DUF2397 family protein [Streptomyces roseochromogenus]